MNTFFGRERAGRSHGPVQTFIYASTTSDQPQQRAEQADCQNREAQEIESTLVKVRAAAQAEVEQRLRQKFAADLLEQKQEIARAVDAFTRERTDYFRRVEAHVVKLALAIAKKILLRESRIDPTILLGIARCEIEKLDTSFGIRLHVAAGDGQKWRDCFAASPQKVDVVEDPCLSAGECRLETQQGFTDLGISAQLQEIESGFCDLIAARS